MIVSCSSSLPVRFVFGLAVILISGYGEVAEGAKKCNFNGEKFSSGEEVLRVDDACLSFYCKPKTNKNGKELKNKVEIVAELDSLENCQCNLAPRHAIDARIFLNDTQALRNIGKGQRAAKNRKKCRFDKKKIKGTKNGKTITSVPERCMELICIKKSKKVSVIEVRLDPDCACSGSDSDSGSGSSSKYTCSDYSEKYTSSHSMCQPKSTTCTINSEGVSAQEKEKILEIHNNYRAKVAKGEEERGNPGPQPSAANMREIVWRQELADVAQAWANTCTNDHDCNECRRILEEDYFVGQNLFWSWGYDETEQWDLAITSFYDEVEYVPNTLVDNFQQIFTLNQIGHYTQLVWGETYEIGCGAIIHGPCTQNFISYPVCKTYVCNYGSAGNIIRQPMYERGPTASNCEKGKSSKYNGLCK